MSILKYLRSNIVSGRNTIFAHRNMRRKYRRVFEAGKRLPDSNRFRNYAKAHSSTRVWRILDINTKSLEIFAQLKNCRKICETNKCQSTVEFLPHKSEFMYTFQFGAKFGPSSRAGKLSAPNTITTLHARFCTHCSDTCSRAQTPGGATPIQFRNVPVKS